MKKALIVLLAFAAVLALVVFMAPASTGSVAASNEAAPSPQTGAPVASSATTVETCNICHKRTGAEHQSFYNELYQDGVIQVSDITYAFKAGPDTATVTFKLTMNGQPLAAADVDNLNIYWVPFKDGKFQFEPALDRLSLKGKLTSDKGVVTSVLTELAKDAAGYVDLTDVSKTDGALVVFGRDGTVGTMPNSRIAQNRYPFMGMLETGAGVKYESTANNDGCVKCHTDPYLKHGYIYAQVDGDAATDFIPCKVCHVDNGEGGHFEWQLLVDNPVKAAEFLAAGEEEGLKLLSEEELAKYAYTTSVMNDVHMSHAMEFPYPQSMANCTTCHEGKLDKILVDANFTAATCRSCHPITGAKQEVTGDATPAWDTTTYALTTLLGEKHPPIDWTKPADCATCHKAGGVAPDFKSIHTGYNTAIFNAEGVRYSDAISVTLTSATFKDNVVNVKFQANVKPDFKDIDASKNMTPTVILSMYGWDTRDFVIGGHERTKDTNGDGKIDRADGSILEGAVGAKHPQITTVSAAGGKWEVNINLAPWAEQMKANQVNRVEIGILPTTVNAAGEEVAVKAVSRTFNLGKNAFDDAAFKPIADAARCENCHEALATTFHEPSYGGSVTVCTMCHITKSGAAHLEMQSRSLESYVHALHSFQVMDPGTIDFTDPVQALKYEHHTTATYPTHGITNCESCHLPGTYNAPDQSTRLPSILAASVDTNKTWERRIGGVASVVTGPTTTTCGGCHRAQLINEDAAGNLAALNQHFTQGGYQTPVGENPTQTWTDVTTKIMGLFK